MKNLKLYLFIFSFGIILFAFFFLPVKQTFVFIGVNSASNQLFYLTIKEQKEFQIRYVHSIHLTDVIEYYEATPKSEIRLLAMTYESLSIGLPGEAGEGEVLELKDGVYTLTYKDRVIDSFTIRIGRVDADLAFRYDENEIDLKEYLGKGSSYEFKIKALSFYQLVKGVSLYD